MSHPAQDAPPRTIQTLTRVAVALAVLVTIVLPAGYLGLSVAELEGALDTEAEISAYFASQIVSSDPGMWRYQGYRLGEILERRSLRGIDFARRILDSENQEIARNDVVPPWPRLTERAEVFDSGVPVGRVEVGASLRAALVQTGLLAMFGLALGIALYAGACLLPVRALRRAWTALARSEAELKGILDNSGDAIISVDGEGKIVLFNPSAEKTFGYRPEEALGKPLRTLLPGLFEEGRDKILNGASAPAAGAVEEARGLRRSGEEFPAELSFSKAGAEGERVTTVFVRDTTERKRAAAALAQVQRLSSVEVLANGTAHEILNPITIIGLYAQRLSGKSRAGSPERTAAEGILRNVGRISRVCQDLRWFSRDNQPRMEPFDLAGTVRESLAAMRDEFSSAMIEVARHLPDTRCAARGDEEQIRKVLFHLFHNALDAMPKGGALAVSLRSFSDGGEPWWEVRIEDTGEGIREDVLPRIFEPYFTTKPIEKGIGLGLYLARGIIEGHKGRLRAESRPGEGAAFIVHLPAEKAQA